MQKNCNHTSKTPEYAFGIETTVRMYNHWDHLGTVRHGVMFVELRKKKNIMVPDARGLYVENNCHE